MKFRHTQAASTTQASVKQSIITDTQFIIHLPEAIHKTGNCQEIMDYLTPAPMSQELNKLTIRITPNFVNGVPTVGTTARFSSAPCIW